MGLEAQVAAGFGGVFKLLHGPLGAGLGVVAVGLGGKTVEHAVVGRVHGHQLPL